MTSFLVLGLNHERSPLDLLERVSIAGDELDKALHDLAGRDTIAETVVLSTCNRTEVYVVAERFHPAFADVRDFFADQAEVAPGAVGDLLYTFHDDEAVRHLFSVAAGTNSAVLGEHEILGQVKRAWAAAQEHGCAGTFLNGVFRAALEAGKRVRTETGIARNVASVSQAAIALADERLDGLDGLRVALVGAGEMGAGVALTLADRDLAELTVLSRSIETARNVAQRCRATVRPFDQLVQAVAEADLVITSTAATAPVIEVSHLEQALATRAAGAGPVVLIDIALPRDVEPSAADLAGVELLDLEAVNAHVARGLESRAAEVDAARSIIDTLVQRHIGETSAREVAPLISSFRARAEAVRAAELERHAAQLADLTDAQRDAVEAATRAALAKVLHTPTVRLKENAATLRGDRLAAALRELFDLD